ncbi:uncharacterized protein LOC110053160 isoform X3 [Orbicella faveolata]|uniref:uncharacterized protein LOC110053160 isoform X3 n=1 Tax=Orbicella faveolata TaxID=48498 RepID=UPI0009E5CCDF|nr:uncharacterized protein LOC110053160 isoform X3 [Orbicella faveolata]
MASNTQLSWKARVKTLKHLHLACKPVLITISERPSAEEVEGSESGSKEIKVDDKKNVEDKVEAADSRPVRYLEEELRECKRDLEAKEREIESLMRRVAHYSDMRTKQDQRHIEETLSLNRQSRVEQEFKAFISHERIDTCMMIQKAYGEKTDITAKRFTSMMIEVVYEYILSMKAAMTDAFKEISKFVVDQGPKIDYYCFKQKRQRTDEPTTIKVPLCWRGSEYPRDVVDGLLLAIKELAPKIDTDIFLMDVKHEILSMKSSERSCNLTPTGKLLDALDDYLKACIKLTWRMVTQVLPLRLEYQTFTYKRECHKILESQEDALDARCQDQKVYYLWPGLMDGGGRIIIKGEVALE